MSTLMKFFDPNDDLLITQRGLPHWAQDGCVVFITWRMNDSLPGHVLAAWRDQRNTWLTRRNIDPKNPGWKNRLHQLPPTEVADFHEAFTEAWHALLDRGHGSCVLRDPRCATVVRDSLLHFNGDRYQMHSFVIMPNHLHLLVTFPDRDAMLSQCESWKRFTGTQLNRLLGTTGRFWQQDAFDHLVRHQAQYHRLLRYLAENPMKARLHSSEYLLYSSHHSPSDESPPRHPEGDVHFSSP
jgi:type I restriction enzyme R subunit